MRWLTAFAFAFLSVSLFAADDKERTFVFKKDDLGKLPTGWKADKTGKGDGSVWKVVADETAPSKTGLVLAQTAVGPRPMFNICVADGTNYKDLVLSVAFKAIKGEDDQGGGLVWRYKDGGQLLHPRMNPLEDNFRVYKVVAGQTQSAWHHEGRSESAGRRMAHASRSSKAVTRSSAISTTRSCWTRRTTPLRRRARSASGPRPMRRRISMI